MLTRDSATATGNGLLPRAVLGLSAAAAAALVALVAFRLMGAWEERRPVVHKSEYPSVSVIDVAISQVPTTIEIVGTIAARYDTPIGVEGDGGRVAAVLVEAGDHVRKGQVLARLDVAVLQPQVANLDAALEQSRAEQGLADAEYRRAVTVGAAGALSAEETERRKSAAVTAAAKVKFAEAQLAEAMARLAQAQIKAPADGVILTRSVEVGQRATASSDPIFRMAERGEVELRGQVAEQDLPALKIGQEVSVRLTGGSQTYPGRVRLLGAVIDPQTRLGTVRVTLAADPNLRPGAFARAEITVSTAARKVLPQTAVLNDDKGAYVLIVTPANTVERRSVHVIGMVSDGVTIADGVGSGDRVVATAGAFLSEGETVVPVAAAGGNS